MGIGAELRRGQSGAMTGIDHIGGSGPRFLGILRQEERIGDQRIDRVGFVNLGKILDRQRGGQRPGTQDFQSVGEEHHLNAGIAAIVAVTHGVDDSLSNDFPRYLVSDRSLIGNIPDTHGPVDFGQDKVHSLVDHVE